MFYLIFVIIIIVLVLLVFVNVCDILVECFSNVRIMIL